jgi:hypothetical protein
MASSTCEIYACPMSVLKLYTLGYVGSPLHIDKGELRESMQRHQDACKKTDHMILPTGKICTEVIVHGESSSFAVMHLDSRR